MWCEEHYFIGTSTIRIYWGFFRINKSLICISVKVHTRSMKPIKYLLKGKNIIYEICRFRMAYRQEVHSRYFINSIYINGRDLLFTSKIESRSNDCTRSDESFFVEVIFVRARFSQINISERIEGRKKAIEL